jgi:hypothetical protein
MDREMTVDVTVPAYEGSHDRADCSLISGWARDMNKPDTPVYVDIFDDGTLLTTVKAGEFRQDLLDAGKGNGKYAFNYRVPPQLKDGKTHSILVKVSETNFALASTPKEINCRHDISEGLPSCILKLVAQVAQRTQTTPLFQQVTAKLHSEKYHPRHMKVHIVCYEEINAWILGKIARRLCENLQNIGVEVDVSNAPDPLADINHHVCYYDYDSKKTTTETVMITHINTYGELNKVKEQLINVEMGICMSFDAVHRLAHFGVPRGKLCYINPAHDEVIKPRKIIVGITTRTYPDGCKREYLLAQLASRISLTDFKFKITGAGWDTIIDVLRQKGIEVDYVDHFDYAAYCELIPNLDYYLYLGQDEGSMGFIDALAAGIPTIVTPQGYHLDVPGGITYAFNDIEELEKIFLEIAGQKKKRMQAVSSWTWSEYARKHLLIWEYLLTKKNGKIISKTLNSELMELGVVTDIPIRK